MQTVFKYPVPLKDDFTVLLPKAAQVLTVQTQKNGAFTDPYIWVLLDNSQEKVERKFRLVGTGESVEEYLNKYVGTFQLREGSEVYHLFELR